MSNKIDLAGVDSKVLLNELNDREDNIMIDDFDNQELIDEIEYRGYTVFDDSQVPVDIVDCDTDDLIEELNNRGYDVWSKKAFGNPDLLDLYTTYQTMSPEFFQKELKKFFRKQLDVNIY
jgi:hypothetical protein